MRNHGPFLISSFFSLHGDTTKGTESSRKNMGIDEFLLQLGESMLMNNERDLFKALCSCIVMSWGAIYAMQPLVDILQKPKQKVVTKAYYLSDAEFKQITQDSETLFVGNNVPRDIVTMIADIVQKNNERDRFVAQGFPGGALAVLNSENPLISSIDFFRLFMVGPTRRFDINAPYKNLKRPLINHMIIIRNNVGLKILIEYGASVNGRVYNETPLLVAARTGNTGAIEILLKAGAAIDTPDISGCTPLFIAAHEGHLDAVNLLLAARPSVNSATSKSCTPLFGAAANGHPLVVHELLAAGAAKDAARDDGATPLAIASFYGHKDAVRELLDGGANVDCTTIRGWTPLFAAAYRGHLEIVRALIAARAQVNKASNEQVTPLRTAARFGFLKIVEELLAAKAEVNRSDLQGRTPLHEAAAEGHEEVVTLLLAAAADRDALDRQGKKPIDLAHRKGHKEIEAMLRFRTI